MAITVAACGPSEPAPARDVPDGCRRGVLRDELLAISAEELVALQTRDVVRGDLIICGIPDVHHVELPLLREVWGGLRIAEMPRLASVALPALVRLEAGLAIGPASQLVSVDLPRLAQLEDSQRWPPNVIIEGGDALSTVDLHSLTGVEDVKVYGSSSATSVDLSALTSVEFLSLDGMTELSAPALQSGEVSLRVAQPARFELPSLREGGLAVAGEGVESIDVPVLRTASTLEIWSTSLQSLAAPALETATVVRIGYNGTLGSVSLPLLAELTDVRLDGNPLLTDVDLGGVSSLPRSS